MTKDEATVWSPKEARLQKFRFSLLCSGNATILFAIWTIVSSVLQLYTQTSFNGGNVPLFSVIVTVLLFGGVNMVLKLVAGIFARSEGLGKRKVKITVVIVLGIILSVLSVLTIISSFSALPYYYESEGIISVIIRVALDITVLYAELDLSVSAIMVKKLESEIGRER